MKVIIFIDGDNFKKGVINLSKKREEFRYIDFYKLNKFVLDYLRKNLQYKDINLSHLRTYYYSGEFTDQLIQRIETSLKKGDKSNSVLNELLERTKKEKELQSEFFKRAKNYYFFELRCKPLQFSPTDLKIFQKGVDVQMAVDLVDFSHKNIFDIAVILSGDIDLLESIKTAKNMGKQIIILGEYGVTAEEMIRYSDFFIDIGRFNDQELNEFTHVPNKIG